MHIFLQILKAYNVHIKYNEKKVVFKKSKVPNAPDDFEKKLKSFFITFNMNIIGLQYLQEYMYLFYLSCCFF